MKGLSHWDGLNSNEKLEGFKSLLTASDIPLDGSSTDPGSSRYGHVDRRKNRENCGGGNGTSCRTSATPDAVSARDRLSLRIPSAICRALWTRPRGSPERVADPARGIGPPSFTAMLPDHLQLNLVNAPETLIQLACSGLRPRTERAVR